LKQRVALRARLDPLSLEETDEYVSQRLHIAGRPAESEPIFPSETISAVQMHSNGLPRLINTLCENALIAAYSQQLRQVTPQIIDKVASDFRLNVVHSPMVQQQVVPAGESPAAAEPQPGGDVLYDLFGIVRKGPNGTNHRPAGLAATASKS